jgi:hypothetical protein
MLSLLSGLLATVVATINITAVELGEKPQKPVLRAGAIRVEVQYDPIRLGKDDNFERKNLNYQIFYGDRLLVRDQQSTLVFGRVKLLDLDRDGNAEVIVETFSGGAHCCTNTFIYSWRGDRFQKEEFGFTDGGGVGFDDLDGDGTIELVSRDQSFYYAYSSYAFSFPPSQIFSLRQGKLVETTRNYPRYLRSVLAQMFAAIEELSKDKSDQINGVLAGYVAQKALLNEADQGWQVLLARYDRSSDWGLAIYNTEGKQTGRYRDFPTALSAHLRRRGYIPR